MTCRQRAQTSRSVVLILLVALARFVLSLMLWLFLLVPAEPGYETLPAALVLTFLLPATLVLVRVLMLGILALLLLATAACTLLMLPPPLPGGPPPLSALLMALLPPLGIAPIVAVLVVTSPRLPPLPVPPAPPGTLLAVFFRLAFSHRLLLLLMLLIPALLGAGQSVLFPPFHPPLARVRWLAGLPPFPPSRQLHLRARQMEWRGKELAKRLRALAHPKRSPPLARAPPERKAEEGALYPNLAEAGPAASAPSGDGE